MGILLYTRPGCHLCQEVEGWLVEAGVAWQPVDITAAPLIYERYKWKIPIVEIDGREVLSAPITRADLRRALIGDGCNLSTAQIE